MQPNVAPFMNMLFEISGVSESLAKEALSLAAAKLPIKTRMIKR